MTLPTSILVKQSNISMANGETRQKYTTSDYLDDDNLYRGYRFDDINEGGKTKTIELNAISFPV